MKIDGEWVIVGGRDPRSGDVVAQLGPGETCLHSTGAGFESRVFCKDQLLALVVGGDLAFLMDRQNKKVQLAAFGHFFEMSADQGICFAESGGAALVLHDGKAVLKGASVLIGENPASPVAHGGVGAASLVSTSVWVPMA